MPMKALAAGVNQTNAAYKAINNIPAEIIFHKAKQYDSSLTISVKTVLYKLKQKQSITLIDIRGAREFERLKIPGSINISLYAIKTKTYLKPSLIVLTNQGFGYSNLEAEGRRLAELGFNFR